MVRPVGSGHSFTPLCVTDGVQVDVSRLDRLLDVDEAGVATAQAGITLHALSAALHQRGRALENLGDVDTQTLAGALATGTHGTGAAFGNLSAQMVGGRLVTAAGAVLDARPDDPDLLRAARVSLGALGVMSEVRVQTVPAFRLHKVEEVRPLAEVLEDLDELVAGHHHVELYALPWSSRSLLLRSRRTDEPAAPAAALAHLADRRAGQQHRPRPAAAHRRPVPGREPDPRPADRAAGLRQLPARRQPPGLRQQPSGAVHRVRVGTAAGRRGRGGATRCST